MKKTIVLSILIATTFLVSCKKESKTISPNMEMQEANESHNDGHNHSHNDEHNHSEKSTSKEMNKKIGESKVISTKNTATAPIIDAYLQIKNGLVATDKEKTAEGGKSLIKAFNSFDMSKLSEKKHKEYMEIAENAKEQAEHIVKSTIAHQREHFEILTEDISDLITLLGTDKTLYIDFCPMANNNKGAYWISESKEIKNPYFGDKMLTCGSVKKQIN